MHRYQRALDFQRVLDEERPEMAQWQKMASGLNNGSAELTFELFSNTELKRRVPERRCLRLRSSICEAYRDMMHNRERSCQGTPLH